MGNSTASSSWAPAEATFAATGRASAAGAPSLALPFAVVGLLGGWLSDGFLANPLVDVVPRKSQGAAAVIAALVGAALGGVLSRRVAARGALGGRPITLKGLAALVSLGGAVTGAAVGALEVGTGWSMLSGAANGGLSGLAFVPVCALVLAAASRADRARQGSIVASADRRAVWGILATALAVTTLAAALDVPPSHYQKIALLPRAGMVMAALAGAVVLAVLIQDLRAIVRVGRLARTDLVEHHARDASLAPSVDLGLGDDVQASLGRAANVYRSRARPVALLIGSVAEARAALLRALLRGGIGLAVGAAVLWGHTWAETAAALVEYQAVRCERSGNTNACHDAGMLLLADEPKLPGCVTPPFTGAAVVRPTDIERAELLLRRGCEAGNRCACEGLRHSLLSRGSHAQLPGWFVPR